MSAFTRACTSSSSQPFLNLPHSNCINSARICFGGTCCYIVVNNLLITIKAQIIAIFCNLTLWGRRSFGRFVGRSHSVVLRLFQRAKHVGQIVLDVLFLA